MNLVPSGSVSVDPVSPPRGASLALSGMDDPDSCISPSARWSAAGIPPVAVLAAAQAFHEQEDLILEANCCPGVPACQDWSWTTRGEQNLSSW